jgi:hypothetical protein
MFRYSIQACCCLMFCCFTTVSLSAAEGLLGGFGKVDITHYEGGPVADPLHARALVLEQQNIRYIILSLDVVALERIGPLPLNFLSDLRAELKAKFGIQPEHVLVNTTHCHGISTPDVLGRTVEAVRVAINNLEPVRVGVGVGKEDRISQNRRVKLKSGREADYRHAYSLVADDEIESIGPIDPDVTTLKVVSLDNQVRGVVYHFACHPIQGSPSGGNTADITGYASKVIEEQLGEKSVALFLQGCGGDINPIGYKEYSQPRDAEKLGNILALTVLKTVRKIQADVDSSIKWQFKRVAIPLADLGPTITDIEESRNQLIESIQGVSLNFKEFQKLLQSQSLFPEFPSSDKGTYLLQQEQQREWLKRLDNENRQLVEAYLKNIDTMESISRMQTNLKLLQMHQREIADIGSRTLDVEMIGFKLGELKLVSFPGELTVRIGLGLKQRISGKVMVCGYSNGYIYYAPTAEQLANRGYAQEDSDCLLAPQWQDVFEEAAMDLMK